MSNERKYMRMIVMIFQHEQEAMLPTIADVKETLCQVPLGKRLTWAGEEVRMEYLGNTIPPAKIVRVMDHDTDESGALVEMGEIEVPLAPGPSNQAKTPIVRLIAQQLGLEVKDIEPAQPFTEEELSGIPVKKEEK